MLKTLFFLLFFPSLLFAQNNATVFGVVKEGKENLEAVNVAVLGYPGGVSTDREGEFLLRVPAETDLTLVFSFIGYSTKQFKINLPKGEKRELNIRLERETFNINTVTVEDEQTRESTMSTINPEVLKSVTSASGNFEGVLKTLPGVSSNNELSSQYSVRGGNFDENLVYVNDIEVYRPFLVRSGQQEGLSFINSDMVGDVKFSAGGFDAKYGDKMSSVLDITYKKPKDFGLSADASLLGAGIFIQNRSKNERVTYLLGFRQKTNQYLLSSLDTKGDYQPRFVDFQGLVGIKLSDKSSLELLGNYSVNAFNFVPEDRTTSFGTFGNVLQLRVFFEGQEINEYQSSNGGLSYTYKPNLRTELKLVASGFLSTETETFDVQGGYIFDEVETDFSKETFGQVRANRGIGQFLDHARNYLDARVISLAHIGKRVTPTSYIQWGLSARQEIIVDRLSEWNLIDSAGYSTPQAPSDEILLRDVLRTEIGLESIRYQAYIQNKFRQFEESGITFTAGLRSQYWNFNNQLLFSPRGTISYTPDWKKDFLFRFSSGVYYQPPFYRELRNFQGEINEDVKAQQSIHYVLGADYNFTAFGRPFKLIGEAYYKELNNLIPYEIDNVRVQYYAKNNADGFSKGLDFKLNGEFVEGLESWLSLSVLEAKEDIRDDVDVQYFDEDGGRIFPGSQNFENNVSDTISVFPGLLPRPADQRVNFSIFFQDELPQFPSYKVHLNLVYGSGLPFGPPDLDRYRDTARIPPYRRVDIGFSKSIFGSDYKETKSILKNFESVVIKFEVFNLLKVSNTISYLWIRDVTDQQFAVPNFLTSRRVNLRLQINI
ncbi:MAG: hypothetical protein ACJATA_001933 [Sphingobacteriales bacterium]|jgi:hypothetical protein